MMKFKKSILYLIPFLLFLSLNELFIPYPYSQFDESGTIPYRVAILMLGKILPFGALAYIAVSIWKQRKRHIFLCALPLVYFAYLVFESLYLYGSFFQFPHVGLKIMELMVTVALFIFYMERKFTHFSMVMNFIIVALFVKIAVDPNILSTASFVEHDRGIPSEAAYLLLLPCLYFFNIYIVELKQSALIKFLMMLGFIVFFQHRTVWVATSVAFLFDFFLLKRQDKMQISKAFSGIIPLILSVFFIGSMVLTYLPDMVSKINENIEDITNPTTEGTTYNWRVEQFKSYLPFIKDHPVEGMRFKGFELPIQFYQPGSNVLVFPEGTGHHFHSFYVDILFYFGIIGIVLFLFFITKPLKTAVARQLVLDHQQIAFLAFVFSGFIYGLSYVIPTHYYAILGVSMAFVERGLLEKDSGQ